MARFFNTTGPCNPEDHYMLPGSERLIGASLKRYVENKLYWVLHAPRQTGKTTFLQSWMRELNASEQVVACYVSVERCQQFPKAEDSIPAICEAIVEYSKSFLSPELVPSIPQKDPASRLSSLLGQWAALVAPKPLVLLFDEVDVLEDQSMISFLRQLRGGFAARGVGQFPVSVALVGMRDLRDYLVKSKDGVALNPGSPFNIKEDSVTLRNFNSEEVAALIQQHTQQTGQVFEKEAIDQIYDLGRGQPWLTNAICKECSWKLCPKGENVTIGHVRQARENLIRSRAVHLDSLSERLRDPRIKHIVETILVGNLDPQMAEGDDFQLALDLGLVTRENGTIGIANPIYREVIIRVLSQGMQEVYPIPEVPWKRPDGTLDLKILLKDLQNFWRRHGQVWESKADYTEAFPHLLTMAFLQKVVNGEGRIEREYAAGRGRMDIAVLYGGKWSILEIKLWRSDSTREEVLEEGLPQVNRYRDKLDPGAEAFLLIFDRRADAATRTWSDRLSWDTLVIEAKTVEVLGF